MKLGIYTFALALSAFCAATSGASALSMTECSAKYKAAQTAGTLNGAKWNDFRKAQCGDSAAATPAAATTPAAAPAVSAKPAPAAPAPTAAAAPASASKATFPSKVDAKYSTMSAGKARLQTCLDQYNANKATNANGGLEWIMKGGGYYSQCNKALKG